MTTIPDAPAAPTGRFGHAGTPRPQHSSEVEQLRERIQRAEYDVDPRAVADAIVERLLAGRALRPGAQRPEPPASR